MKSTDHTVESPASLAPRTSTGVRDTTGESIDSRTMDPQLDTSRAVRAAKTYRAILLAARVAIADGSFDATSLRQICERVGVTKGALYHHFRDKLQLFERVFELCCDEIFAEFDSEASRHASMGREWGFAEQAWVFVREVAHPSRAPIVSRYAPAVLGDRRFGTIVERWPAIQLTHKSTSDSATVGASVEVRAALAALIELASCRAGGRATDEEIRVMAGQWAGSFGG